jgi:DNA repair protein RadC
MPERRRPDPLRYQLPFEWSGTARELGRHVREIREPLFVRTPTDAVSYFLNQVYVPFEHFRQEQLYVLLLDQKNRITHDVLVYKGTVNSVNIRTAELFMEAVHFNSPSIILAHNHPSGEPSPSPVIWR